MSAEAEVRPRAAAGHPVTGPLRVRPPSPLPPQRRKAIAVVAVLLVVIGLVLVLRARSTDGSEIPGSAWRALPVPRAARVDAFDGTGPLGSVDGFGTWQVGSGSLQVGDGLLRSTGDQVTATVDAGSSDVLVQAQLVQASSGAGLVLSATGDGAKGLWLVTTAGDDGWDLRWQRGAAAPQVVQSFPAPHRDVSVQAVRRGNRVKVSFDDLVYEVDVPADSAAGTYVGITSAHPGNAFDLFGYLPLDPG
ncbi:MAG: hypothetical protein ACTHN0_10465 [Aquihabitans sp.]